MIYKVGGVIVYLGILLWLGVLASRRMKDIKDYFAAGKNLGFLAVAFSGACHGGIRVAPHRFNRYGLRFGVKAFWVVVGEVIGVVGAWIFMSKRFKRLTDQYDSITVPDYLESRFKTKAKSFVLSPLLP